MPKRFFLVSTLLVVAFTTASVSQQRARPTGPARLEAMRNVSLQSDQSGFPVSIPMSWGRLVSVQKTEDDGYMLFLQNENAEIYLVRLTQRGKYLYLDTYDQGGVALVIARH